MKHTITLASSLFLLATFPGCEFHYVSDDVEPPSAPVIDWAEPLGRTHAVVRVQTPYDEGLGVDRFELELLDGPRGQTIAYEAMPAQAAFGGGQSLVTGGLRPGVPVYMAVTAIDGAGNRSARSVVGPVISDFDPSGAILPLATEDGDNALGYQIVRADFNRDGLSDLAVSAPFKSASALPGAGSIYVHFGAEEGLEESPAIVIDGDEASAQLGNALAVIDWNGDGVDDLAAGAPFAANGAGEVLIYDGASLGAGEVSVIATISSDGTGWYAGAAVGFTLANLDFNGDRIEDLAISAVAGGGQGAILLVYGAAAGHHQDLILSETAPVLGDASVTRLLAPRETPLYGISLANAGEIPYARGEALAASGFQSGNVIVMRGAARTAEGAVTDLAWSADRDIEIVSLLPADAYFGASIGSIETGGGRELVVSAYRANGGAGTVFLLDLHGEGTMNVESITTARIEGAAGGQLGTAIANNANAAELGDVDGDGLEDLVLVGGVGEVLLAIWYGDALPAGVVDASSAHHALFAPVGMKGDLPLIGGTPATATWIGDADGDGLEDLAWADWTSNASDGLFEVLR